MTFLDGDDALRCLSGRTVDARTPNVVCPNCDNYFTHMVRAGTLLGYDEDEAIVYEGTQVVGAVDERRSAMQIVFVCEACARHFALIIQQHKGVNSVKMAQDVELMPLTDRT